jgi:ribonuclease D
MTTLEPFFIETPSALEEYCSEILANSKVKWLAIDTEFVRVDTYYPQLSLVQIQDNLNRAVIIDPLAVNGTLADAQGCDNSALMPFIKLLAEPKLIKVFHSARQDIEVLYQLADIMPTNIFDTQIAAIFAKHGDVAGFARVIKAELGIELAKSQTRTNWHARPLTEEQIEYALDDVRYLAPLYEKYCQTLTDDQIAAVFEDSSLLLNPELYRINPEHAGAKIKNTKGLRSKSMAIVYRLAQWREEYAIAQNQPKKWVMSDDVIVQIAQRPPKTVQALYKVPGIKSSSVQEFGEIWIELIDEVFALETLPSLKSKSIDMKPSAEEEHLIEFLYCHIKQVANDYSLVASHLANKNLLLDVIREQDSLTGWRACLLSKDLQTLIAGEATLQWQKNRIELITTL